VEAEIERRRAMVSSEFTVGSWLDWHFWPETECAARTLDPRSRTLLLHCLGIAALAAVLANLLLWLPGATAEENPLCVRAKPGVRHGEIILLDYGADMPAAVVGEAIDYWRSCDGYRRGFPSFVTSGEATRTLRLHYLAASGSPKCGSFRGRDIYLYEVATDDRGRLRSCGSPARLLAHELGHALGLSDCPATRECNLAVMSNVGSSLTEQPMTTRDECAAVNAHWLTPFEMAERTAQAFEPAPRVAGDEGQPIVMAGGVTQRTDSVEPPLPF
jgi:hypothetical protein